MKKGIGKVKRLDNYPDYMYESLFKKHKKSLISALLIMILGVLGLLYMNDLGRKQALKRNPINQIQGFTKGLSEASNDRREMLNYFNQNGARIQKALNMAKEMGYNISKTDFLYSDDPEALIQKIEKEYETQKQKSQNQKSQNANESTGEKINEHAKSNDLTKLSTYDDDKYKFSVSFPANLGVVRKLDEDSPLQIQATDYDATFEFIAFPLSTISNGITRSEYLKRMTSVGASSLEGKLEVKGAEEAYLIRAENMDVISKYAIAFKGDTLYRLSYFVFGKDKNNEAATQKLDEIFNEMIRSFNIEN